LSLIDSKDHHHHPNSPSQKPKSSELRIQTHNNSLGTPSHEEGKREKDPTNTSSSSFTGGMVFWGLA
jgi:hypothetical protein